MKIQTLTKSFLKKNLKEIIKMDFSERTDLEKWTTHNFLLDLPLKFQLSLIAAADNQIIGYTIASKKGSICHIHRIFVSSKYSGQGIGSKMISSLEKKARARNLKKLLAEALKTDKLRQFYLKNGLKLLNIKDQTKYSLQKDPEIRDKFLKNSSVFIKDL